MRKLVGESPDRNPQNPFADGADPDARADAMPETAPAPVAPCPLKQKGESVPIRVVVWQLTAAVARSAARARTLAQLVDALDAHVCVFLGVAEAAAAETVVQHVVGGSVYYDLEHTPASDGGAFALDQIADALSAVDAGWTLARVLADDGKALRYLDGTTVAIAFRARAGESKLALPKPPSLVVGPTSEALGVSKQWVMATFAVDGKTIEGARDIAWDLHVTMPLAMSHRPSKEQACAPGSAQQLPPRAVVAFATRGDVHDDDERLKQFYRELDPADPYAMQLPEGTRLSNRRWEQAVREHTRWLIDDPCQLPGQAQDRYMHWSDELETHYSTQASGARYKPERQPQKVQDLGGRLTTVATIRLQDRSDELLVKERRVVDLARAVLATSGKAKPPPEYGALRSAYLASGGNDELAGVVDWVADFSLHWPMLIAVSCRR